MYKISNCDDYNWDGTFLHGPFDTFTCTDYNHSSVGKESWKLSSLEIVFHLLNISFSYTCSNCRDDIVNEPFTRIIFIHARS